jgi:serine/threonine protein kinase
LLHIQIRHFVIRAIEQFKSEAKILFKLKQENLPKFEDYFDYEENRYLIIEYIEGKRLNNIVESQSGFLDEQQVIKWGIELCDSLGYLHNLKPNPVIFRDLSPQSILLSENDGRLKLIDFGISKIYESDAKTMGIAKTMTQHYSPIEQHAGTTDNRSDIYSLGATLYYLICKEPPMDCVERIIDD